MSAGLTGGRAAGRCAAAGKMAASSLEQKLSRLEAKLKQENREARRRIDLNLDISPQRPRPSKRGGVGEGRVGRGARCGRPRPPSGPRPRFRGSLAASLGQPPSPDVGLPGEGHGDLGAWGWRARGQPYTSLGDYLLRGLGA